MSETVLVAIITVIGGAFMAGIFALVQSLIKLKFDERVHMDTRADTKDKRYDELREEFKKGLDEREATGKERFDINSKMIQENSEQIAKLLRISEVTNNKIDNFADSVSKSFNSINKNSEVMGEGVKSVLYDKITVIYDKCLSRCDGGAITSEEESNIEQLYMSYSGLGGNGEGKTMFKKACAMKTVTKEEADRLDHGKTQRFT